jgi:hypothetical protein
MLFSRRQFLQFTSSLLATYGISALPLWQQTDRYARALTNSKGRKLALLVGINDYLIPTKTDLKGCLTDVELQKALLIHRFGFHPSDILTLTNNTTQKPSRRNILTAFEEHLIKQARPDDVVIFHFSGHGDRFADPAPLRSAIGEIIDLNTAFMTYDPVNESGIMGRTLFLLLSALKTNNVTTILDTCHSGGGTRGNVRIRSLVDTRNGISFDRDPIPAELATQDQWIAKLNLTPAKLASLRNQGIAKGIVIASAQAAQEAIDYPFEGFHAGLFTYLLTQYLWHQTGTTNQSIANILPSLDTITSTQTPFASFQPQNDRQQQPIYFLAPQIKSTTAVVTAINNRQVECWLGGVERDNLKTGVNFSFDVIDRQGQKTGKVEMTSRQGLQAQGILQGNAQRGDRLQETARTIPDDWQLIIGLDPSLGDSLHLIQTRLQKSQRILVILWRSAIELYGREVHYILSRMTPSYRTQYEQIINNNQQAKEIPPIYSIGLLTPSIDEVIPGSFANGDESLNTAIDRLIPKIQSLLAARLIKLTLNAKQSQLSFSAILQIKGEASQLIGQAFTIRGQSNILPAKSLIQNIPANSSLQFQIVNSSEVDLYLAILEIDSNGDLSVLVPMAGIIEESIVLKAGTTKLIPKDTDNIIFSVEQKGAGEVLILASKFPFRKAISARSSSSILSTVENFLQDLTQSRIKNANKKQIPTSEIAALSISFTVI